MQYEIRTYSEDFLEKQFEIGNSILKDWPGTGQTQVENLKQLYSQQGFDPETKFYAFHPETGEMVGFQTATIKPLKDGEEILRANMEFPLVQEEHEEVVDQLMQYAMTRLKEKGVARVQSRGSPQWGKTMNYVEKYGYELKRTLNQSGTTNISNIDSKASTHTRAFAEETDLELVREMYLQKMKMPEAQLENQLQFIKANPEAIASWNVMVVNGKLLGNSVVTYLGGDKSKAIMANVYAEAGEGLTEEEVRAEVFHANVQSLNAKGVEELNVLLFGNFLNKLEEYEKLGFAFNAPLNLYHREI